MLLGNSSLKNRKFSISPALNSVHHKHFTESHEGPQAVLYRDMGDGGREGGRGSERAGERMRMRQKEAR